MGQFIKNRKWLRWDRENYTFAQKWLIGQRIHYNGVGALRGQHTRQKSTPVLPSPPPRGYPPLEQLGPEGRNSNSKVRLCNYTSGYLQGCLKHRSYPTFEQPGEGKQILSGQSENWFCFKPILGGTVVINLPRIVRAILTLRVVVVW